MNKQEKIADRIVLWATKFGFDAGVETASTGSCYITIYTVLERDEETGEALELAEFKTVRVADHDQSIYKRRWADYEIRTDNYNDHSDANIVTIYDIVIDLADAAGKPRPAFVHKFIAAKELAAAEKAAKEKIQEEQRAVWAAEAAAIKAEAEAVKNSLRGANSWRSAVPFIVAATKNTTPSPLEATIAMHVRGAADRNKKTRSRDNHLKALFDIFGIGYPENRVEWRCVMNDEGFAK